MILSPNKIKKSQILSQLGSSVLFCLIYLKKDEKGHFSGDSNHDPMCTTEDFTSMIYFSDHSSPSELKFRADCAGH